MAAAVGLVDDIGMCLSRPSRLDGLIAEAAAGLPDAFWEEAESALPAPEHWLEPPA